MIARENEMYCQFRRIVWNEKCFLFRIQFFMLIRRVWVSFDVATASQAGRMPPDSRAISVRSAFAQIRRLTHFVFDIIKYYFSSPYYSQTIKREIDPAVA